MKFKLKYQFFFIALLIIGLLFFFANSFFNFIEQITSVSGENSVKELMGNYKNTAVLYLTLIAFVCIVGAGVLSYLVIKKVSYLKEKINRISKIQFDSENKDFSIGDEFCEIKDGLKKIETSFKYYVENSKHMVDVFHQLKGKKSVKEILEELATLTEKLFNVKYVAITVFDEYQKPKDFIYRGLTPEQVRLIGEFPQGKGLLGYIHETKQT